MTPLRFRAWHKEKKIMTPSFDFRQWEGNTLYPSNNGKMLYGDLEIMQSTGLKDKNGKEIFEGDIMVNWAKQTFPVSWNQEIATYDMEGSAVTLIESDPSERLVIIGNIYDNPELL